MTREETIIILKKFKAAYRNFYKDMKKEEAYDMIGLWEMMFAADDAKLVQLAIIKLIAIKPEFPPSIAKIREAMAIITQGEQITVGEAWQEVIDAIKTFGWTRSREAVKSLSPLVRETVDNMGGFIELCKSETVMADRAHFMKIFEILSKREKENAQLPENLKLELKKARESYRIARNENLLLEGDFEDEQYY